jgi:hypothetical protein
MTMIRTAMRTGEAPPGLGFGGGGGGRGGGGEFAERPGESLPVPSFGAPTGGRGAPQGPPNLQAALGTLRDALGEDFGVLGLGGRGGGGGGGAPIVGSGDYRVSIVAGGRTISKVLRVERVSGDGAVGIGANEEDDEDASPYAGWFRRR